MLNVRFWMQVILLIPQVHVVVKRLFFSSSPFVLLFQASLDRINSQCWHIYCILLCILNKLMYPHQRRNEL